MATPPAPKQRSTTQLSTCGDCGMPVQRRMRYCTSCRRPMRFRHSFLKSSWYLVSFWLTVVAVLYGTTALVRFVVPFTLRVTCVKQVVPSRLVAFRTPSYTTLLSAGDCAVPRGALVLLTDVPAWLRAIAVGDTAHPAAAVAASVSAYAMPLHDRIIAVERRVVTQLTASWRSALHDMCTPAWIARWCTTP